MLALIGVVLTGLALLFATAVFIHERRRSPECRPDVRLRAREKQRTIAIWTIGRFYQSLRQFDDYCIKLEEGGLPDTETDPTKPSRDDLLRFAGSLLLTSAIDIIPFSQGKANLFHFADGPTGDRRTIVSQVFSGPFPPSQVLSGVTTFREMLIERDHKASTVAAECVRLRLPRVDRITKKSGFSGVELKLGTTHILGIPTELGVSGRVDDFCRVPLGSPASITVDLRIVLVRPALPLIRRFAERRSQFICHRLARYSALLEAQVRGHA